MQDTLLEVSKQFPCDCCNTVRTATSAFSRVLSKIVDFSTACLLEHEVAERGFGAVISTRIFGSLHWEQYGGRRSSQRNAFKVQGGGEINRFVVKEMCICTQFQNTEHV